MVTELDRGLAEVTHGSHSCLIYNSPGERLASTANFVKIGLEQRERCVLVDNGQSSARELLEALQAAGVDGYRERRRKALLFLSRRDFQPHGEANFQAISATLRRLIDEAVQDGFSGLRLAIDMPWAASPDVGAAALTQLEALVNTLPGNTPASAVCQYDRRKFPPGVLLWVLRSHPYILLGGHAYTNRYYEPHHDLADLTLNGEAAARRVDWIMAELRQGHQSAGKNALGSVVEVTGQRIVEMLDRITDGFFLLDREWRFTYVNQNTERFFQMGRDALIGATIWDVFPGAIDLAFGREYYRAVAEQVPVHFEEYCPSSEGQGIWFEVDAYPTDEGLTVYCRDISERKRSERVLQQSEATAQRLAEEHERLAEIGRIISASPSLDQVFDDFAAKVRELVDFDRIALTVINQDRLSLYCMAGLTVPQLDAEESKSLEGSAALEIVSTRRPLVLQIDHEEALRKYMAAPYFYEIGLRSWLAVPLISRDEVVGVFYLYSKQRDAYAEHETALAERIAGQCAGTVANARLYSELMAAEQAVKESEERLSFALESSRVGAWEWDIRANEIKWSDNIESIHGLASGSFGGTFEEFQQEIHPDDRERVIQTIHHVLESGDAYNVEYRLTRPDRGVRWMEARGRVVYSGAGQPVRMTGICMDITVRKQTEEALRRRERLLTGLLENNPDLILRLDRELRFLYLNPALARAVEELAGVPAEALIGKTPHELSNIFSLEMIEAGLTVYQRVFETGQEDVRELAYSFSPESVKHFHRRIVPGFGPDGTVQTVLSIARDITDLKQAEQTVKKLNEELHQRVEELETVLNVAPVAIGIALDPACQHVKPNVAFAGMLGIDLDQNASKSAPAEEMPSFKLLHDGRELAPDELPMQVAATRGVQVPPMQIDVVHEDGAVANLFGSAAPLFDEQGQPRGSVGAFLDITELKQAGEALRREAEERQALAEIGRIVSASLDINQVYQGFAQQVRRVIPFDRISIVVPDTQTGTVTTVYSLGCEVPGLEIGSARPLRGSLMERVMATRSGLLVQGEDRDQMLQLAPSAPRGIQAGLYSMIVVPLIAQDQVTGGLILRSFQTNCYSQSHVSLAERIGLQIGGAIANAQLYGSLMEAEHGAQRERQRFQSVLETAPVGIFVVDANQKVLFANREIEHMFGFTYSAGEPSEKHWTTAVFRRPDGTVYRTADLPLRRVIARGERVRAEEVHIELPGGRRVPILANATPILAADGTVIGGILALQDISALEQAQNARTEFLGVVSHEMRNPLTIIKGSASTVLNSDRPIEMGEARELFEIIDDEADKLKDLIDNLLDINRIESGTLSIRPEPVDLKTVLERAQAYYVRTGGAHRLVIEEATGRIPPVLVDPDRIEQVLLNLVNNASKFSPRSAPITIQAEPGLTHITVKVHDQGIGIPPDKLSQLFMYS